MRGMVEQGGEEKRGVSWWEGESRAAAATAVGEGRGSDHHPVVSQRSEAIERNIR